LASEEPALIKGNVIEKRRLPAHLVVGLCFLIEEGPATREKDTRTVCDEY
jgi:hypothetical protein